MEQSEGNRGGRAGRVGGGRERRRGDIWIRSFSIKKSFFARTLGFTYARRTRECAFRGTVILQTTEHSRHHEASGTLASKCAACEGETDPDKPTPQGNMGKDAKILTFQAVP